MSTAALAQNLAVVNGKPIPASYSDALVKELVSYGEKDTPQLRQDVKNKLVLREVLVQEAEKQNIASTDEVKKQLEFARRSILIDALRSNYLKKNPVSDKDVKAEYDRVAAQQNGKQYHVKHILVKTEAEAQNIINQLNKGTSFEKLAKEKSIDQSSAANGGDLGWASHIQLHQAFLGCHGRTAERPDIQNTGQDPVRLSYPQGNRCPQGHHADTGSGQTEKLRLLSKKRNGKHMKWVS